MSSFVYETQFEMTSAAVTVIEVDLPLSSEWSTVQLLYLFLLWFIYVFIFKQIKNDDMKMFLKSCSKIPFLYSCYLMIILHACKC